MPRKCVVRLTDRPDMTLDIYRGRKTTMQQQQKKKIHASGKNNKRAKMALNRSPEVQVLLCSNNSVSHFCSSEWNSFSFFGSGSSKQHSYEV